MAKSKSKTLTTNSHVGRFEMLAPILDSLYTETKELSKKKQDGVLNELKVKMINKVLLQIKELLSEDPSEQFLQLLDDETLPTNSDGVLILAQFRAAMAQFREKYYRYDGTLYENRWFTEENP